MKASWADYERDRKAWVKAQRERSAWGWVDWCIVGGAVLALVLVLSCDRPGASNPASPPSASFDPAVWCGEYREWSDAWCACVWAADSTYFTKGN